MAFTLKIINGDKIMTPCVVDGVDVEWTRQGSPGQMTFTVINDAGLSFVEGNAVTLNVDGTDVFLGFVVKKSRDKEQKIEVTCLDQLFYLTQNKTVYVAEKIKANEAINVLAKEKAALKVGDLPDTGYTIEKHRWDSATSYLDIMQELLDITLAYSGNMFVLYDDFGTLTIRDIDDMKFNERGEALLVSEDNAENFDYESSIENSYNDVTLWQSEGAANKEGGTLKEVARKKDDGNIQKWGSLTYFEILDKDTSKENALKKAEYLLELHNQVKRKLSIKGVFCDPKIRGGSSVLVAIDLGEVAVKRWFVVESVKHHFANDYSTMDLDVRSGKGFVL